MSPGDTALACIAAAVGLCCIAPAAFDAWHRPRTHRRFQQTAQQAAADVAATRAARDLATCKAIWHTTPHDIPHPTRRTEEDQ
jgi:hypothetical protein